MTLEDLEKAGYHKFTVGLGHKLADFGMQRVIYTLEGDKKAYYITIYCYDRSKYPDAHHWPDRYRWGFQPEVQFYQDLDLDDVADNSFSVTLTVEDDTSVEEMEDFFARVYRLMRCMPDAHNN